MKIKGTVTVMLLAIGGAGIAGYQLAKTHFTPGAIVMTELMNLNAMTTSAYDPLTGPHIEVPTLMITENSITNSWCLVLMGDVKAQSKADIGELLAKWSALFSQHPSEIPLTMQINLNPEARMQTLDEALAFISQYGFQHVSVNGLVAGHNYVRQKNDTISIGSPIAEAPKGR